MIPLQAQVGEPVHHQHRARSRAARPRGAQRLRQPVDRPREHQRGEPRLDPQGLQPAAPLRPRPRRDPRQGHPGDRACSWSASTATRSTPSSARSQFLIDNKISFLKLFTPCPYPGTKYYDDMAAGRPHPRARLGPLRLRQPAHPPGQHDRRRDDGRLQVRLRRLLLDRAPSPSASSRRRRGSYLETLAYLVANLKVNRYLRSQRERLGDDLVAAGCSPPPLARASRDGEAAIAGLGLAG